MREPPITAEAAAAGIEATRLHNAKLGMLHFAVYLAFYLGFVFINAFRPGWMETIVLAGLNLAIVYGFGLIIAALLLALLYGHLCRTVPVAGSPVAGGDEAGGDEAGGDEAGGAVAADSESVGGDGANDREEGHRS